MRGRWGVGGIAAVAAALSFIGSIPALAQQAAKKAAVLPCGGEEIARGSVSRVLDGRTFVLGDGREVRLAGIETASSSAHASDGPGGEPIEIPVRPGDVPVRAGCDVYDDLSGHARQWAG